MALVDREVLRAPVDLPGAREDDPCVGVHEAAGLEQRELCTAVDLEVRVRVGHGVEVARLSREAEDDLAVGEEIREAVNVADVRDVHRHSILDAVDVRDVAAVLGNHRVHEQHLRAGLDEPPGQVRADEAEATGDQHAPPAKREALWPPTRPENDFSQ